jgi:hypothetical protein
MASRAIIGGEVDRLSLASREARAELNDAEAFMAAQHDLERRFSGDEDRHRIIVSVIIEGR